MMRFLGDALRQAIAPEWRLLAVVLLVLATATNAIILSSLPEQGAALSPTFIVAAVIRVARLVLLNVAFLRSATRSSRALFMPDGAFWMVLLFTAISAVLSAVVGQFLPDPREKCGRFRRGQQHSHACYGAVYRVDGRVGHEKATGTRPSSLVSENGSVAAIFPFVVFLDRYSAGRTPHLY